jgi:hypothetical protein
VVEEEIAQVKGKGLLIAVGLLAVLGGLVWWSNKKQSTASKSPAGDSIKMLSITGDQFQAIRIKKLTDEVEELKRVNGKWLLTEPKPLPADQDAAAAMVTSLATLTADKVVEEKAGDLQPYGLHIPTLDITITKNDGKTERVLIGDDTPTGSGAYAKVASDPRVFMVSSFIKTGLDKPPADLRDKRLLTFDQDKLTRVELQAKGQAVEFGRNSQNEWQIVKPRPLRADSAQVDTLVAKLKDARMDITGAEGAAKQLAAATKVAGVSVTDASGTQTIEVRRDKDKNEYARSSAVEGLWKISGGGLGESLDKSLDDFRNKKLFDFGFSDPGKVELKGAAYIKTGDKWLAGSKTMDNASVQNLIDKLRDLAATKFAERAGGEPVFEAAVTSGGGKRAEKVTIFKEGARFFAKRESEPSIYELDGKAVEDLQKAAAEVKEAAPEPAKKKK